ncbi:hypothetical protein U1Q18_021565 [Sarracenia purpurea var. burkii]
MLLTLNPRPQPWSGLARTSRSVCCLSLEYIQEGLGWLGLECLLVRVRLVSGPREGLNWDNLSFFGSKMD